MADEIKPEMKVKEFDPAELSMVPNQPRCCVSWITTDIVDHIGDVVVAEGVDYKSAFLDKNPVILAIHDNRKWPVGLADHIKLKQGNGFTGLMGMMHFDEDPDALRLFGMVQRGVVRGQSIAFMPPTDLKAGEWGPPTPEEIQKKPHWKDARCVIRRCVLVEWSFVPIPMNRQSLVVYVEKGLLLPSFLQSAAEKVMAETNNSTTAAGTPPAQAKSASDETPVTPKSASSEEDTEKSAMCKAVASVAKSVKHSGERGHAYYSHEEKAVHHDMADEDDGGDGYHQAHEIKAMYREGCKGLKRVTVGVESGHPGEGYEKVFPPKRGKPKEDGDDDDDSQSGDEKTLGEGSYVKFTEGRKGVGCVASIHKDGDPVPDVDEDLIGTADEPVARIRVYKAYGDGFKATSLFVAAPVKALQKVATLKAPSGRGAKTSKGFSEQLPELPSSLPTLPSNAPIEKQILDAFSPAAMTRNFELGIQRAKDELTGKLSF